MAERFLNIRYPFEDSSKGYMLEMNQLTKDAVKSDLLHLLLTDKGKRFYMPDFGTDLKRFIFNPNDNITHRDIMAEIQDVVNKFIPGLKITNIQTKIDDLIENAAIVRIDFLITDTIFDAAEFVEFEIRN